MNLERCLAAATLAAILAAPPLVAQETPPEQMSPDQAAMMEAWKKAMTPGEPHAMLAKAEGTWKMTVKTWMDPAAPPSVSEGVSEQKMILGGRVLQQKASSEMMGMSFDGVGMTGYDNLSGKYWATWVDSMSTGLFTSYGTHDEATSSTTFHGEYQDPITGEMVEVRAVSRAETDDKHVFEWYEIRGGEEVMTMEITYLRQ